MEFNGRIVRNAAVYGAFGAALVAVVPVGAASGSAAAPAARPVPVRMTEWAIVPVPAAVPAGRIAFRVRNAGDDLHEIVVLRTDRRADALGTGSTVPERGAVGEIERVPAGTVRILTLRLKKGHYVLICNLRNHYRRGMRAGFDVR